MSVEYDLVTRMNALEQLLSELDEDQREAVTAPDGPILVFAGAGSGKCVSPTTRLVVNDRLMTAKEVWQCYHTTEVFDGEGWVSAPSKTLWVDSFDEATGQFRLARIISLYRQHVRTKIRFITFRDGSRIEVTKAHRFFDGLRWKNEVKPGDVLALPARLPHRQQPLDFELAEFLGWLVGEGYERQQTGATYEFSLTLKDKERLKRIKGLLTKIAQRYHLRISELAIKPNRGRSTYRLSFYSKALYDFLTAHGHNFGRRAAEKRVPDCVMRGGSEGVRHFLQALFDAEGWVEEHRYQVGFSTASPCLAEEVRHLLRRFGIWARLMMRRKYATNGRHIARPYWLLYIGGPSLRTFAREIGFSECHKSKALERCIAKPCNPNRDLLPSVPVLRRIAEATDLSPKRLLAGAGRAHEYLAFKRLSRPFYATTVRPALVNLANMQGQRLRGNQFRPWRTLTEDDTLLIRQGIAELDLLALRELVYEEVAAVEEVDYEGWVYDFMVEGTNNFVAEGILCHNTRVLTYRVAYLLLARRVPAHRLFAVTFTNKAADEMRQRLEHLVGKAVDAMWLGTFHAACARMLRLHGKAIGLPSDFVIYDEDDQRSVLKAIFKELNIDTSRYSISAVCSAISNAKNEMVTPEELAEIVETPFQRVVARVYRRYQEMLQQTKAVDFDDLLWLALRMLKEHPEVADYYQTRFLHVLVDEYQDVNRAQHELALLLAGKHRNLFCVGDDDQAIYSFRLADVRLMLELPKRFPDLQIFVLERNYRSTQMILDTAWHVIQNNKYRQEKRLKAVREGGEPIVLFRSDDDHGEAAFVGSVVIQRVKEGKARYRDFAVIYRINAQSRPFEETFIRWGIPYRVVGALRFYERKEVKDLIAYLRILVNPSDEVSLLRAINLPPRGIGDKTIEKLRAAARQRGISVLEGILSGDVLAELDARARLSVKGFSDLVQSLKAQMAMLSLPKLIGRIVQAIDYENYIVKAEGQLVAQERMENIAQLIAGAERQFGDEPASQTLHRFLEQLALLSPQDETNWQNDAVTLITAHSAKGLEFPVVFVVGLEEGLFPHSRSLDDAWQLEEERRLFYVALTRAKDHAFLCYAQRRGWLTGNWGEARYASTEPSRFLNEVPMELVDEWRGVPTPQGFLRMEVPTTVSGKRAKVDVREVVKGKPSRLPKDSQPAKPKQIGELKQPLSVEQIRVGMRVNHQQFGMGTVIAIDPDEKMSIVVVRFDDEEVGEKRLALAYAPLKVLR